MLIFDGVNTKLLGNLLHDVHTGAAGLPNFKKNYFGDPSATISLVAEVARDCLPKSILTVGNANHFAIRKFENAPDNGLMPKYLVLDGQRRLTSLYQALFGTGEYRYYLDIHLFLDNKDLVEEKVIKFAEKDKKIGGKTVSDLMQNDYSYQAQNKIMPLSHIFGASKSFHKWAKNVEKTLPLEERDPQQSCVEPIAGVSFFRRSVILVILMLRSSEFSHQRLKIVIANDCGTSPVMTAMTNGSPRSMTSWA